MSKTTSLMPFRRLASFLYDCLLLLALFMLITAVAVRLNNGEAIEHVAYKLALLPIAWFFFAWFWSHGGQTLGMRAWRIKIIDNNRESIGFTRAFVRAVVGPLLLPAELLGGLFRKSDQSSTQHAYFGRMERVK